MEKITNNNFVTFLKRNHLKPTLQRFTLVKLLFDGKNKHFTAEDLYEKVKLKKNKISLATIYNTLHSFVEKKLLKQVSIKDGKTIFCTNMSSHHHFFNSVTGKLIDIPRNKIKLDKIPRAPEGLKIDSVDVVINLTKKN
ncbi:MAG: Ferric uptake regulation protein [Alphaproteobacteria bacterium MarineAlpha6_Bin1]|nr:MAG: Ferric uptake regulation protein [Alphaproteobacteria bacterium MarineAlpha6_Bin1]